VVISAGAGLLIVVGRAFVSAKFKFRGGYGAAKFAAKHKSSKYVRAFF
jgi:hypothetical protein